MDSSGPPFLHFLPGTCIPSELWHITRRLWRLPSSKIFCLRTKDNVTFSMSYSVSESIGVQCGIEWQLRSGANASATTQSPLKGGLNGEILELQHESSLTLYLELRFEAWKPQLGRLFLRHPINDSKLLSK
jgi:hypothetical protein